MSFCYSLKMSLTKDERVEVILLSGREGWSYRRIAEHFNACHPGRAAISHRTVGKLIQKFKDTGSVFDKLRSGRPSVCDEVKETVIAKVTASPKKSTRQTSMELGVPRSTVQKILKADNFHRTRCKSCKSYPRMILTIVWKCCINPPRSLQLYTAH